MLRILLEDVSLENIDPLPRHPSKDHNISDHFVLAQNVCVI